MTSSIHHSMMLAAIIMTSMVVSATTANASNDEIDALVDRRDQINRRIKDLTGDAAKVDADAIREQLEASFDVAVEIQQARIRHIENELQRMQQDLETQLQRRDQWVASRLESLSTADAKDPYAEMIDPKDLRIPVALLSQEGWAAWRKQDYREALPKFLAAYQKAPKDVNVVNGLGWTLVNIGDFERAAEMFEAGLKIEPAHGALLNGLGQSLLAQNQSEKALKVLEKATQTLIDEMGEEAVVKRDLTASWLTLIRVAKDAGKNEMAIEWADRYLAHKQDKNVAEMRAQAAAK